MLKKLWKSKKMSWAENTLSEPPLVVNRYFPAWFRPFGYVLDERRFRWAIATLQRGSEKYWRNLQDKKVQMLTEYARRAVPYWRRVFAGSELRLTGVVGVSELFSLPVSQRADLKKVPLSDLTTPEAAKWGRSATTSGSTGEPFSFFQDARQLYVRQILRQHELSFAGPCEPPFLAIDLLRIKHLSGIGLRIKSVQLEDHEWRHQVLYPHLRSSGGVSLLASPSHIRRFIYHCKKDGVRPRVKSARYFTEEFPLHELKEAEEFLGVSVFGIYGSQECSLIAMQCSRRRYHLASWVNYVEILDGTKSVPQGTEGDIVITSLDNRVMPFIRYKIGDRGAFEEGSCVCGASTPTVRVWGRSVGMIEFRDGSSYTLQRLLAHIADKYSACVRQFQIEEKKGGDIVFRYVLEKDSTADRRSLKEYVLAEFADKARVILEEVDYILPNKMGKTPIHIKKTHESE